MWPVRSPPELREDFFIIHLYKQFSEELIQCMSFCDLGRDLELGWLLKMLLDLAQFCRADQRIAVFLGEGGRDQNFKIDLIYHMSHWIGMRALYDPNAIRW